MNQHFEIIITCYNVEKWIGLTLESLLRQNYKNWAGIIIDDCSTDNTCNIINELIKDLDKFIFVQNKQRLGKLQNLVDGIYTIHPQDEDVFVFLDGDDWLSDAGVLDHLAFIYKDDVWVTWGSYIKLDDLNPVVFDDYSEYSISRFARPAPANWEVRKDWRFSHLKTCKYFLWKNVKDKDLRENPLGGYFPGGDDLAFMYPMVEMAGPAYSKYVDRLMYIYNNMNPKSLKHTILKKQMACCRTIQRMPKYSQKTKNQLTTSQKWSE